jgi:hypothetical protein
LIAGDGGSAIARRNQQEKSMYGKLDVTTRAPVTKEELQGNGLMLALYSRRPDADGRGPDAAFEGYARKPLKLQRYSEGSVFFESVGTVSFRLPSEQTLVTHAGIVLVEAGAVHRLLAVGVVQGPTRTPVDMLIFGPGNIRLTRAEVQ